MVSDELITTQYNDVTYYIQPFCVLSGATAINTFIAGHCMHTWGLNLALYMLMLLFKNVSIDYRDVNPWDSCVSVVVSIPVG